MTKRTADEALVGGSGVANDCDQNKERRPSPADGDDGRASSHRISLISSSSSCSIVPASGSNSTATKSFRRTVTSISSAIDDSAATQAGQKIGNNDSLENTNDARQLTRLINGRILQRDGTLLPGSIDLSNGLIVGMRYGQAIGDELSSNDDIVEVFDCQGQIISPGFIDIQLNGAYGVDFSNDCSNASINISTQSNSSDLQDEQPRCLETKDILHVAQRLVETGVTSFCPTMVSSSRQTYRRILSSMRIARKQQQELRHASNNEDNTVGATILGMHLEGPFFALSKRGAHDLQHIVDPVKGMSSVEEVYGINQQNEGDEVSLLEDIDIVTLAPELHGAFDAIKSLTSPNPSASSSTNPHSVVVSCGHTEATYEDGIQALSSGATLLTHLYNAMNPFHHRKPGLVGLLSSEAKLGRMGIKRPFYSMIVDGLHVHESAVCMAYQSHPHGCVLVTDAMTAMGLGDGNHYLGNMKVSIKGDRATLAGTDTLAGSVVSMDTCVKRFHRFSGCSIGKALLCATLHPAMVLKRHVSRQKRSEGSDVVDAPIGILEVGAKADILMLTDDLSVIGTWVAGRLAFQKK